MVRILRIPGRGIVVAKIGEKVLHGVSVSLIIIIGIKNLYKNILISTDGSEFSDRGLHSGFDLARSCGSRATVVTVTNLDSLGTLDMEQELTSINPTEAFSTILKRHAQKVLDDAVDVAQQYDVPCDCRHIEYKHPAEGIIEAATNAGCDLIVMASHGRRGMQKLLLGSVASEVLTHATLPVMIVK